VSIHLGRESTCPCFILYIVSKHTHTHPFNCPLSRTTRVSRYEKGKTSLDFTEARDSEWQWHQLGRMHVCISLQTDNHPSTQSLRFLQAGMPFLPPNQQSQSTEGRLCLNRTREMISGHLSQLSISAVST